MHHTFAYFKDVATATPTDVTPVPDTEMLIQNGHFVPNSDLSLLYALGQIISGTGLMRLITPTLRQITTPYIRPVSGGTLTGVPIATAEYLRNPPLLKALEEIELEATQASGGNLHVYGVLGASQGLPAPSSNGPVFTMRGVGSTTVVAGGWSLCPITWQDSLPAGVYAVLGAEFVSATCVAGRLVFEGQYWRPGGVGLNILDGVTPQWQCDGSLGEWGRFNAYRMPNVEFLADAADTSQEIYLYIVRIR